MIAYHMEAIEDFNVVCECGHTVLSGNGEVDISCSLVCPECGETVIKVKSDDKGDE